jgi:radical SAM superfamily enzyme YgiQ (UPF0313 family)
MPSVDIVIISVPGTVTLQPPAAPALLKASIESQGFTCKTLDFNIRFYHKVSSEQISKFEGYFCSEINLELADLAVDLIDGWAKEVAAYNSKFVGISVFTYQNRVATRLFCQALRKHTKSKIVLGGQGLTDGGILGAQGFAKELINLGLADYYIKSEGEQSLVELLKGNTNYNGINSDTFTQVDDLNSLPIPNYSDYQFELYEKKSLPITASRGCVRACSFCDIHDHWEYRYQTGENIVNEIISLSQQHNIFDFRFTDSLVNGNLKEFKVFCKLLAEYNRSATNKIHWTGQYIVRGSMHLNEQYWEELAASGGEKLAMGIESGSDQVRQHMNKNFTNSDLDYTMEMLDKYSITCVFLMLIGYPTETEKDFQDTLDMFTRYRHLANRVIVDISFGSTLGILPNTPLYKQAHEYHIELDKYENNWISHDNPTLTIEERISRRKYAAEHAINLGYKFDDRTETILSMLENQIPMFEKRNKVKKLIKIKQQ